MVTKTLQWHGATLRAGEDGLSQCPNWGSVFAGECLLTWCWRATTVAAEQHGGGKGGGGTEGGGWWGRRGGSALALNLVPVQKAWGRVAASQAATARRQDIPAQDEETSVTTCYANPEAGQGKGVREGRVDGKDSLSRGRSLFCVCTLEALCFGNEMCRSK